MRNPKPYRIMPREVDFRSDFRRFGFHYFAALVLILGIKYWYGRAGSEELEWILLPTARWVEVISGIPFEKAPQNGYVNHSLRFMIAPSCSGVRFMLVAFSVLAFPFIHRMRTAGKGWGWMMFAIPAAYLYTIVTNGLRIALAAYLPSLLEKSMEMPLLPGWLTQEKLHTLIGTAVYFASLLFLYRGTEMILRRLGLGDGAENGGGGAVRTDACFARVFLRYLPPAVCYFTAVLFIPLLRRIYRNDWAGFWDYAGLVTVVCLAVLFCFGLTGMLCKRAGAKRGLERI